MTIKVPMTKTGAENLQTELQKLKTEDRPEVIKAIAEARAHGDLKENAEYHAAKEQQSFIEGRIADIEANLSNSQIIDVTSMECNGKVIFGATVKMINLDNDQEVEYQIVGDDEADLKEFKISVNSPIARAIIGKAEDDEVSVVTPGGEVEYSIKEVKYI